MAANLGCRLVVVHGPPSPAVPSVLRERIKDKEDYLHVHPLQLYQSHPGFGVRDVANHVVGLLRKHKKVVVENNSALGAVKDCLLKVIPTKIPSCNIRLLVLAPKHGQLQSLWEREFFLAASSQAHRLLPDEALRAWFDENDGFVSQGSSASVPTNCSKETVPLNLTAVSNYKFEVPAVLIQWECALDSGDYLEPKVASACQHWAEANPCGRVVLLCDGNSVAKGLQTAAQEKSRIISCAKALANKLPCPVYVVQVTSTLDAGDFCAPPNPGLLAFVHKRHCIDLQHKGTLYIYKDVTHMKMAEKAGVRHMKVTKVLKKPEMILSSHSATHSPVPDMLRGVQVVLDSNSSRHDVTLPAPSLPLADRLDNFTDQHICVEHPRGHCEFVFAKDLQLFQRFQKLYAEKATQVGESGTRLAGNTRSKHQEGLERSPSVDRTTLVQQTSDTGQLRQIPQWMMGRRGSSSADLTTHATLEKSLSTSSVEGKSRSRHTVYIMTEKELVETAQEILKQAGVDIAASDVPPTRDMDSADHGRLQDPQPQTPGKRAALSVMEDVESSRIDEEILLSGEIIGPAPSERKKQRFSPPHQTEEQEPSSSSKTKEKASKLQKMTHEPDTSKESETTSHLSTLQKNEKPPPAPQKRGPDLSVLDDIFS
ncbi:uncharacterized protein [Littorina saxatilis]|uniref:Uncharacterized protein n=1 Tax=Littorina saxatilis TaxID=31220 RepID=A0AAN9BQ71_9CAEN